MSRAAQAEAPSLSASAIRELLFQRHLRDVFVSECKLGSSWGGARRLDAWVMRRSWSPLTTRGYEIKVSRGDWLGDDKWHEYRRVVHEMWIAAPRHVVAANEVPDGVGVLRPASTGSCLIVERKAQRQEPDAEALAELLCYVVMSRSRVVADMWEANAQPKPTREERVSEWARVLSTAETATAIDKAIKGRIGRRLADAERGRQAAETKLAGLEVLAETLRRQGVNVDAANDGLWWQRQAVQAFADPRIAEAKAALTNALRVLESAAAAPAGKE